MQPAAEALQTLPIFRDLTEWQRHSLGRCARRSMFHAGNRIFRENEPADRMWLIISGRVVVDATHPGRGDVVIDTLGPGEALGWSWMFPPYRWHFGATAAETTLTVELDGPQVRVSHPGDLGGRVMWRRSTPG
jgi:CRP/FNR family transcriptional regulator, cyclic AMP receptor protein